MEIVSQVQMVLQTQRVPTIRRVWFGGMPLIVLTVAREIRSQTQIEPAGRAAPVGMEIRSQMQTVVVTLKDVRDEMQSQTQVAPAGSGAPQGWVKVPGPV